MILYNSLRLLMFSDKSLIQKGNIKLSIFYRICHMKIRRYGFLSFCWHKWWKNADAHLKPKLFKSIYSTREFQRGVSCPITTFCCWDIWILNFCWHKHKWLLIRTFPQGELIWTFSFFRSPRCWIRFQCIWYRLQYW